MMSLFLRGALVGLLGLVLTGGAEASLSWTWSYSTTGIDASGTFTTEDTADSLGFYLITGITGQRNGVSITGLQPTGTAIPGNEPYAVDNLISTTGPQLTGNGFGFSLANGTFANPFWADFYSPPAYLEFFSNPSVPSSTEYFVNFEASIVSAPVPEPSTLIGMVVGFAAFAPIRRLVQTRASNA